jgi:large subunit ribosomal protein L7Ae
MAKSYVKFEVSNEVVAKTYEALQMARQSGTIRKGANEVTKSVERGLASIVIIAADVDPEEVVVHLPTLCEGKRIAYSYVPSKAELGKAIGMNVPCTAVAVEKEGSAAPHIREIKAKVSGSAPKATSAEAPSAPKAEKPVQKKAAPQQKKEEEPKSE